MAASRLSNPLVPVTDTLSVCANELLVLAGQGERLQALLSAHFRRSEDAEAAQSLDLLTQSLSGLAQYLSNLSAIVPAEWSVDPSTIVRDINLDAMARRLLGAASLGPAPSGDLDLFGDNP